MSAIKAFLDLSKTRDIAPELIIDPITEKGVPTQTIAAIQRENRREI